MINRGFGVGIQTATTLLAHDPLSSLAYSMSTHTPPVAGNLPIKTLVARQWPTNYSVAGLDGSLVWGWGYLVLVRVDTIW